MSEQNTTELSQNMQNSINDVLSQPESERVNDSEHIPEPISEQMPYINLYGSAWDNCQEDASVFEDSIIGSHYKTQMCLKDVGSVAPSRESTLQKAYSKLTSKSRTNPFDEVKSHQLKRKCVLPIGHSGPCSCTMNLFKDNLTTSKIKGKIEQSIYSTPGADDYVIKNRDSRLHPIAITKGQERMIKDKNIKLSCAIPLKEQATPFQLSTAYLDYITYILNISDIDEFINKDSEHYNLCIDILNNHKLFLEEHYGIKRRKVFDSEGHTICAVLGIRLSVSNLSDPNRDNRTDIRPTDIQMGHISSRCDDCYTVYGTNIVMMTRRGNLIIGEHSFIEDTWINELRSICSHHSS